MKFSRSQSRKGITLLFVISMIVLFLLMGTTFVVVANNFMRSAQERSRLNVATIDERSGSQTFISQALFDLLRGPSLDNVNSPLRGHSILGDMYGFGLEARVKSISINMIERPNQNGTASTQPPQFIRLETIGLDTFDANGSLLGRTDPDNEFVIAKRILRNSLQNDDGALLSDPASRFPNNSAVINAAPGRFNGLLVTFVTDGASGITGRIVDHQVTAVDDSANSVPSSEVVHRHTLIVQLLSSVPDVAVSNLLDNVVQWDRTNPNTDPTRVIINGRPFAGTGAGRFTRGQLRDNQPAFRAWRDPAAIVTANMANVNNPTLIPNFRYENYDRFVGQYLGFFNPQARDPDELIPGNSSSVNESYDAYDFQNMFLSGVYHNFIADGVDNDGDTLIDEADEGIIPSFHRRELARFNGEANPAIPNIDRRLRYSFRPEFFVSSADGVSTDPRSTASARFPGVINIGDPADPSDDAPWFFGDRPMDVDNDNDGIAESVWTDIGLPTVEMGDGRRAQPLVAYHVVDLDSKINVNAHGNRSQIADNNRFIQQGQVVAMLDNAGGGRQPYFGMGLGPAEVDLRQLFSDFEVERLLVGDILAGNVVRLPGRYGFDPENNFRRNVGGGPVPGVGFNNQGFGSINLFGQDVFSAYKLFGYPNSGMSPGGVIGGFFQSSPMDIYGRLRTDYPDYPDILGITGMPVIDVAQTSLRRSEIINNPYETSFLPPPSVSNTDTLFTVQELERIYRQFDHDAAGMPDRLAELANSLLSSSANRTSITTDSFEVATQFSSMVNGSLESPMTKLYRILSLPNTTGGSTPSNIGIPLPQSDLEETLIRENRILQELTGFFHEYDPSNNPTGFFQVVGSSNPNGYSRPGYLSSDIRSGRAFDVNRPFGNGRDDEPRNGVFDEPTEYNRPNPEEIPHPEGVTRSTIDHNNDSVPTRGPLEGLKARQRFARELYVLALLTCELVDRNGDGVLLAESSGNYRFQDGDFPDFPDPTGASQSGENARREFRKVMAQWAINVADFRDPDSIMTPFEVDLNPWNGWNVDGDIGTTDTTLPAADRFTVWGTERPELLISETYSMHDRKTQDTPDDPSGETESMGDTNPDSRQVPVASAFFELYNPWNQPGNQVAPQELYAGQAGVDLTLQEPENLNPVWRMVVVQGRNSLLGPSGFETGNDPDRDLPPVQRYVYFNTPVAGSLQDENVPENRVYFPDDDGVGTQFVEPGGYAIIGSAGVKRGNQYTTFIGRREDFLEPDPTDPDMDQLNLNQRTRRIELDPNGRTVRVFGSNSMNDSDEAGVAVLPIVGPFGAPAADRRSLGLTDPVEGYTNVRIEDQPGSEVLEIMQGDDGPYFFSPSLSQRATADTPADQQVNQGLAQALREDGLRSSVFVVMLQRLADPTRAFNTVTNPYRTCDSTSVDLYVFNGLEDDSEGGLDTPALHFQSYERRSDLQEEDRAQTVGSGRNRYRMLWKTEYEGLNPDPAPASQPAPTVADAGDEHVFDRDLVHSFGSLNQAYVMPDGQSPNSPFAWLQWNNRPFASALELANVPYTSSFFLTSRFDVSQAANQVGATWNPFNPSATAEIRSLIYSGEFPHLLNFFADEGNNENFMLQKLFDYVEVPSRYVGTETYLNPGKFSNAVVDVADEDNLRRHSFTRTFAPPFDYVSNFRDPGKVNINTITDARVWNAVMGAYATNIPDVDGNGARDEQFLSWLQHGRFNPYRSSSAANWVPELAAPAESDALVVNPADTGLFRRRTSLGNNWPLAGDWDSVALDVPFFDFDSMSDGIDDPLQNSTRNAFHRYNKRNRLGNMVTGRSSMFAIWITVGYFEIESEICVAPDGTQIEKQLLGAEVTDEFSQVTRNRGFFIFDRSIPVAFEPGKNHNIERAIRVSSFIE